MDTAIGFKDLLIVQHMMLVTWMAVDIRLGPGVTSVHTGINCREMKICLTLPGVHGAAAGSRGANAVHG